MRVYILVLVLFVAASCQAQVPHIKISHEGFATHFSTQQALELWTNSQTEWQLRIEASAGLGFVTQESSKPMNSQFWQGSGGGCKELSLDLCFDLTVYGQDSQQYTLEIALEGAQGILGLPLRERYWILALNSDGVVVKREDQIIPLGSGQWFLTEPEDRIYLDQERVYLGTAVFTPLALPSVLSSTEMWWEPVLPVEAGERSGVSLNLRGPLPSGKLMLQASPKVALSDEWVLEPAGTRLPTYYLGDDLVIELPALGQGEYQLNGSLLALLPTVAQNAQVTAFYDQLQSTLQLPITRTWFDFDRVQVIQLGRERPAEKGSLLLPDGSSRYVGPNTTIGVKAEGLDLIIPLNQPQTPHWIGTPLTESELWELPDATDVPDEFFLPIFLWDGGLKWRLVTKSGPWFLDANKHRKIIRGQIGSVKFMCQEGRIDLLRGEHSLDHDGSWLWFQDNATRRGTWQQGNWSATVEIPRGTEPTPFLKVRYVDDTWRFSLEPRDLSLSYREPHFTWGFRWGTKSLWLELFSGQVRLEMKSSELSLGFKPGLGPSYGLHFKSVTSWQAEVQDEWWEAYVRPDGWGARLKIPGAHGPWRFLTLASGQMKNGLVLGELEQRVGYVLSPQCTVYVLGSLRSNSSLAHSGQSWSLDYGVGLVYQPLPQIITDLSWNKSSGWQFRGGVVVPFVGRNKESRSE